MSRGVKTQRPTAAVRRGLARIHQVVADDFDNAFERLFPDIDERGIMDVMEAANWIEQYMDEEVYLS